jgi:DNA/RNA-binding domain of Phe-tRNA-synthetase-like protein
VGYKFRDGEIVSIDEKGVTFRQWDVNSTVRTAFRTIVKSFKREEGKR